MHKLNSSNPNRKLRLKHQGASLSFALKGGAKLKIFLLMIIAGLVIFVLPNLQVITDMIIAREVKLSSELMDMTSQLELTSRADLILRASNPQLQNKQQFNQNCKRKEATAFILGCYNGRDIFVYQVDNLELKGISEVTLAHELLHAVYRRMNPKQQAQINRWLVADYQRLKTPELEKRMEMYNRTQPGQFENELHSILGTEFAGLSDQLERHYQQVFKKRQAIVALHQASQQPFKQKQQQLDSLKAEINAAEKLLKNQQDEYERSVKEFNSDVEVFNQRAVRVGGFASQTEFQTQRSALAARQAEIKRHQSELTIKINQFNQKIEQYNQTSLAIQELTRSLDSLDLPQAVQQEQSRG